MSVYSKFLEIINGMDRQIDLSKNTLEVQGLQIDGAVSGAITHAASATTTSYSLTWPAAQAASAGYVLANNGSGVLSWVSAAAGSALDGTFRIQNTADNTKQIAFDASGISHATTRTLTLPDANVDLGNLTNLNISASAAIAYSKLNLASSVAASDMNSGGATSVQALFANGTGGASYRSLASSDIPNNAANTTGTASNVTGVVALINGGTGTAAASANAAFNALSPMSVAGDIIIENATPTAARLPIGSSGEVLTVVAGLPAWAAPATSGTVTSVGLSDASTAPIYDISNSPVTGAGTLTFTLKSRSDSFVFAGPASGSAQPGFRALVATDIPSLSSTYLPLAGGTMSGAIAMGTHKITGLASGSATGDALQWGQIGAANGIASLDGSGKIPVGQLPSVVMEYQGAWNPALNSPALSDATGTNGYVYWVTAYAAGPVPGLADPSMVNFQIGDLVIFSSTASAWQLVTPAAGVSSVNGAQGAVTVNAINQLTGDVTASAAIGSQSKASFVAAIQGTAVGGTTGSGNVVFSASPTMTGTANFASISATGSISTSSTISGSNLTSGGHASADLEASNNLSDVSNKATAFNNISPMTTAGDLEYELSAGTAARLGIGSAGQVLTVVAGAPAWAAPAVSPSAISLTNAHILVGNVSNLAADVAMSGDVTIDNTGATTIGSAKITASKLSTITDGITLDQSGTGAILEVKALGISNAQISTLAGIVYSKLNLATSIVNGDISESAAIAYRKLNLSGSIVSTDLAAGAVTAAKLGAVTDGITLDQPGTGATLEIKLLGVGTAQLAAGAVTTAKLGTITDGTTLDQIGGPLQIANLGVNTTQLAAQAVTAAKLATGAFDSATIVGGNGTAAAVQYSPSLKRTLVAGQSFTANTSYAVRWGLTANGETAGRIYVADITTSSHDLFYVIGMASSATAVSPGQTIAVTTVGSFNLSSADAVFTAGTDGAPVFLGALGSFSTTPPSTAGQAIVRIGMVQVQSGTTISNVIDVNPSPIAVN